MEGTSSPPLGACGPGSESSNCKGGHRRPIHSKIHWRRGYTRSEKPTVYFSPTDDTNGQRKTAQNTFIQQSVDKDIRVTPDTHPNQKMARNMDKDGERGHTTPVVAANPVRSCSDVGDPYDSRIDDDNTPSSEEGKREQGSRHKGDEQRKETWEAHNEYGDNLANMNQSAHQGTHSKGLGIVGMQKIYTDMSTCSGKFKEDLKGVIE